MISSRSGGAAAMRAKDRTGWQRHAITDSGSRECGGYRVSMRRGSGLLDICPSRKPPSRLVLHSGLHADGTGGSAAARWR
jgi:hypothetical protein